MILTRSAFPGQQRYAAATWSGDIGNGWDTLERQIAAGLNMAAAGYPYWTVDAGGFFRPGKGQYEDPAYREVIRLFIREEQRHARELGRFMKLADIPLLSRTWPDTVFRWLRHRAGLELSITVLLTAEILAKVYYVGLRDATGSALLQRLCEQILADEIAHVRFQAERLAILRQGRAAWRLRTWHGWQRMLFWGACWVVWWGHARALRAALGQMDSRRYLSPACIESANVSREPAHER